MWNILHMRVTSLVAIVAPRTGKTVKKGLALKELKKKKLNITKQQ